ncbi:hypothetical protein [Rossellomorea sp. DA94]|uniref:hypothetical protein n=1 Tax=Rossellomorea sp. DA94 TaxID=3038653 RepID=UPI00244D06A4|nr:hypothetical protein [Rossellomorea sp. DA94]WGG48108.1 hypothetical protein P8596_15650 [Rossellomorea sp. DA94]
MMKDGYKVFMDRFNITENQMIEFGLNETIFIPKTDVYDEWRLLKGNIFEGKNKVYVRGYGRDAKGTQLYINLYKELFGHSHFIKDPTNNAEPTKLLKRLTGFSRQEKPTTKYKRIRNYQVSHIFGRTKNPFSFTAPWNIVYVPKIMDPFTGHESKGELTNEFQRQFLERFYDFYQEYIEDFNMIMQELEPRLMQYLFKEEDVISKKFKEDALQQFSPIIL